MESQMFNSLLIRAFSPGDSVDSIKDSPIVYHYTSPESFFSIIRNKQIRFSDIRYMNDKSETTFFVKRLIEFVEANHSSYPSFCEALNALLMNNDYQKIKNNQVEEIVYREFPGLKMQKQRNFIFCTSKDADALNMWNYYVANGNYKGYNIGLSIQRFLKTFDTADSKTIDPFLVFYGSVIYDTKKQNEEITHLAKQTEKYLLSYKNTDRGAVSKAAISIQNYIVTRGPFFKDSSFKSENEYRILLSMADKRIPRNEENQNYFGQNNKEMQEDFYCKNGLIIPFLKVIIPDNAISRITMSPMIEFEIAKSSIKELLAKYGFINGTNNGDIPIYKSSIPVRF